MKLFLFLFFCIAFPLSITAQKKIIDSTVFDRWPTLNSPAISANGKYVVYIVDKIPSDGYTLVIHASDGKWKKEIVGALYPRFTEDSRWLLCNFNTDSLCLLELGTERTKYYSHVQKYEVVGLGRRQWIAMKRRGNGGNHLLLRDLTNGTDKVFPDVIDFGFSKNGKSLVIERTDQLSQRKVIEWINTEKWESWIIFNKEVQGQVGNFTIDSEGKQVVFLTLKQDTNAQPSKCLWYYKVGMEQAAEKLNSRTPSLPAGCIISDAKFSPDGSRIFFEAKAVDKSRQRSGVMVDIWSYTDDKLQAKQLDEINSPVTYKGVINLEKNEAIIIQGRNEQLYENRGETNDYSLLTTNPCYFEENNWRSSCRVPLYLVNTRDGTRRLIKDSMVFSDLNGFSPDGKYVLYYDPQKQAYFSYSVGVGKTVNIAQNIPFPISDVPHARAGLPKPYSLLPRSWLPGKGVIINDEYDLWLLDPTGTNSPICLTNGYGRANGIMFRIIYPFGLITEQQVILVAFRPSDKTNGFYSLNLAKPANPELLTMGPYLYCWQSVGGQSPIKAKAAKTWIIQRRSESESPNLFITKDFKSFLRLSSLQPQSNYNWLTTELHEWKTLDGKKMQGILYKPENFDPSRKYPVIFHFYEEKSDELHQYLIPEATGHHINIPHFVSNGYLIFVPDIHYTLTEPAVSVYNAVVSAAQYLSNLPFVDSARMGMQGHSFGAYGVNVLVTKTNLFAAAAEAAGVVDFVSGYGSIVKDGNSTAFKYEYGQYRIGATLWQKPDLYVSNSPIFYADKVNTPILIMHCKNDGAVPFEQGIEWYTALRRLGKKVWMLQYDDGGHQLGGKEANDYTIRLMQFFDHYLKGKPAPKWMINGMPATLKGIATGFEYEPINSTSVNLDK
ncbi:S9 family peptidase [Niastella caeni]|uniref:S9 family peptidase n=1 Tax=Niastella caeni TaxID=2569763 RepID=A0A4V4H199_9BACT|nr:prolyl oligopeptidase family serine peptidase [Niastella caeni]THU39606.1 S9 family peptidase [Niastella caeni]